MTAGTVLVVDDELDILQSYREIFSRLGQAPAERLFNGGGEAESEKSNPGYDLITASSGEDGVQIVADYHSKQQPIHAIFLDVRMPPGIDGLETAKRMREIDPWLQIVICTAYSDHPFESFIEHLGTKDRLFYLEKPFAPDEVLQMAHALVGQWTSRREIGLVLAHLHADCELRSKTWQSPEEIEAGIAATLLNIADLTGTLSTALVDTTQHGQMNYLLGTGMLQSQTDITRARQNRMELRLFSVANSENTSTSEPDVGVLLLQPHQSADFCRQLVQAAQPCLHRIGELAGGNARPESQAFDPGNRAAGPPRAGDRIKQTASADNLNLEEFHGILSSDPGMKGLFEQIRRVAQSQSPIFVTGETGTGKEMVARAIHEESSRAKEAFVAINCANLSESMLESQLFGHRKGAFTGAIRDQLGLLGAADGGTLFLDEVSEIPITMQAKLLRVLQEREYVPLGDTKPVTFDAAIVSASHKPLRESVEEGRFRNDLYFRLHVIPLELPRLADRSDDPAQLFSHFLEREFAKLKPPKLPPAISDEVWHMVRHYDWPGNVRELQNVCAYVAAMSDGTAVTMRGLPSEMRETYVNLAAGQLGVSSEIGGATADRPRANPVERSQAINAHALDAQTIRQALAESEGNRSKAAKSLGVSRMTLWRYMRELGLS